MMSLQTILEKRLQEELCREDVNDHDAHNQLIDSLKEKIAKIKLINNELKERS